MENIKLKKEILNFLWSLTSPPIPISDKAKEEAGVLHSKIKNVIITDDVVNDESIIIKANGCECKGPCHYVGKMLKCDNCGTVFKA